MNMNIKHDKENNYIINGMVLAAKTYKEAITEYLNIHSGSIPIFIKG